jgi:predicted transcriptional regulator
MKISEIKKILNAKVLTGKENLDKEIYCAGASDLMSDVLAYARPKIVLLTGLTTNQVIYTCEMAQIDTIIFVRGKEPSKEVIELAKEKGFVLLATKLPLYDVCGILYEAGLTGTMLEPLKEEKRRKTKT